MERTDLGCEIETALGEVLAHVRGETGLSCRIVDDPAASRIVALRKRLRLSRQKFADRFGLDVRAVQEWEQGRRVPDRAAHLMSVVGRRTLTVLSGFVLVFAAVVFAAAWYYASEIEEQALAVEHESDPFDLRVVSIEGGRITLETTAEPASKGRWAEPGIWGLESAGTYNQLGSIVEADDSSVVRELIALGTLPRVGEPVRIDRDAFPSDPWLGHGIEFREVGVPAALGTFPAWLTPGDTDTWAILVHGKGAERTECLRILPMFVEQGHSTLTITYRNDEGVPESPGGYYQFGADEWEDLEAAVEYALAAGAGKLILAGYSMGGAIVLSFLYHSVVADRVKGVILDSPALDFEALIDHGATQEIPVGEPLRSALTDLAMYVAAHRFEIDYRTMDHLERVAALSGPVLLFHGSADTRVPVWLSDRLAEARPDIVEYEVFDGAIHVGSWNQDRERYEHAVRRFLTGVEQP